MSSDHVGELTFLDGADGAYAHQDRMELFGERGYWWVNNSGIDDYSERARILGSNDMLKNIISATIGHRDDNVGIDIAAGSDAEAVRNLLDMGLLRSALATNYNDERSHGALVDLRLSHIAGDITHPSTWYRVAAWQRNHAPDGFALAMHRPIGGLQELPLNTYYGAASFILDRVRPGGLMFTQVPRAVAKNRLALAGMCRMVRQRPDVTDVITSTPAKPDTHPDLADMFAVIFKK